MAAWTPEQLAKIGGATELRIASQRADGTLRPFITIWVARSGDEIYVRSAHGVDNPWFRRAIQAGRGRISAGGIEADVFFETPTADAHPAIDTALHTKYDRYGPGPVGAITGRATWPGTLRLTPTGA